MAPVDPHQIRKSRGQSSIHLDQLNESQLQSAIFRGSEADEKAVDFSRLANLLQSEGHLPKDVVQTCLLHVQDHVRHLGLERPGTGLILHWLTGLLREKGYSLGDIPVQSLELSLSDVELNIYHPMGFGAGGDQNPEATSQRLAQRIKTQFACRRIFQEDIVLAHDQGLFELLHLGAIDRPLDIFLTPDYLKLGGMPVTSNAPAAGPAHQAEVLLAHLIRFTHELRNHFAGDIHWGYVNTLLLPFLADRSQKELGQFVQQMLFEFAQLNVARGGFERQVILDFDLDMPRQLRGVPARGSGGHQTGKTYGDYEATLQVFNEVALEILANGDYHGSPFHSPRIIFHLNDPKTPWSALHHQLMAIAFRFGNPSLAFSYQRRNFGPLGMLPLTDPDFLKTVQEPGKLRGFSSSALVLNLPRWVQASKEGKLEKQLASLMELAASGHRQKRLFISRLMAYGNRGPLQFLRHKWCGEPFLKIDQATQPMQVIGLSEAAALVNGSPTTLADVLAKKSEYLLQLLSNAIQQGNRLHKLKMLLCGTKHESVAYRFAALDMREFGPEFGRYVLHHSNQAQPIYSEGPNILGFVPLSWRERLRLESRLHPYFTGDHASSLFVRGAVAEDSSFLQMIYQESQAAGTSLLQIAPDLQACMACFFIFSEHDSVCPRCKSSLVTDYGLCQSHFSPVHTWCLGKRGEWKIRYRLDDVKPFEQPGLPL